MPSPPPPPDPPDSLIERRIRQVMDEVAFHELPGAGRPIPGLDQPYDPAWWAKRLIEREQLGNLARLGGNDEGGGDVARRTQPNEE